MTQGNTAERIYRDESFEGIEVRNRGGSIFNIWTEGERVNYFNENGWCNLDYFTRYPEEPAWTHDANSSEAAAVDWFNNLMDEREV